MHAIHSLNVLKSRNHVYMKHEGNNRLEGKNQRN